MIRINLLRQNVSVTGGLPAKKSGILILSLVLLSVCLAGLGEWWWRLGAEVSAKQRDLLTLEQEASRLAAVHKQVVQFEGQRKLLEERIAVIEQLKRNQTGPVDLLNIILTSVPDRPTLWLTSLSQKGKRVTVEGRSFDVPSIADFISALSGARLFQAVELAYWQEEEPGIKFQLNCNVR